MNYSDITFKDRNPIKRWLQQRRLVVAMNLANKIPTPDCILDFGAGNGELCKLIAKAFPHAKIICYEPTPELMDEAKENLADLPQISFHTDIAKITPDTVDIVFCLEVYEHLPKQESITALKQTKNVLHKNGHAIIGVPVEIGLPALYKGLFRMTRRYGKYDATLKNVLKSTIGAPPKDRPVADIAPGFAFHHEHMGFDYRSLQTLLSSSFKLLKISSSPTSFLGLWINPEAYFVIQKS